MWLPPGNHSNHEPLHWGLLCRGLGWMAKMCLLKSSEGLQLLAPTALEDRLKHNALYIACANGANSGEPITSYGPMVNVTTQKGPVVSCCSVFTVVFVVVTSSSSSCSSTCCSVFSCLCWSFHLGGEASGPFHKCGGSDINNSWWPLTYSHLPKKS